MPNPIYVLAGGWYHRPGPGTDCHQPGWTPELSWLATTDLERAVAALGALQQQGYDMCALVPMALDAWGYGPG